MDQRSILGRVWRGLAIMAAVAPMACVTTVTTPDAVDQSAEDKAAARRDLGMDHLSKGRTALAIRTLLDAQQINPLDHETHLWLGEAYRRKGMLEEAELQMLEALRLKPDSQSSRLSLSGLYIQMERFEDAIRESRHLYEDPTFPTPWRALTNIAWAEYRLGRMTEAKANLEQALDFHPTFWPALLNLGILENDLGNRLEALEAFERVIEQNPGARAKAEATYRMGEVFVAIGHRERAIRYFSDVIDEAPYGPYAKESKRYLKMLR